MTNKRDKMELICQKASEIGIQNIIIRTSKRSVIQDLSENKISRINLICVEAAEQSHNRNVTQIKIVKNIKEVLGNTSGFVIKAISPIKMEVFTVK